MSGVLTISDFYYEDGVALRATVTWDPANPGNEAGAQMTGQYAPGVTWIQRNNGVAFLTLIRQGANLEFRTWGTDTNGKETPDTIDIFTLPIDLTGPFPPALWNTEVPSPRRPGHLAYVFSPLPGNPNGFKLTGRYGPPVPPCGV